MISNETINKVNDINIIDLVEKYHSTKIKKAGVNLVTSCPWHDDKHPSFTISPAKQIATCFVCDRTVNGIGLVMDIKNLSYPEAVKTIANDFGIKIIETGKKKLSPEEAEKYKEKEAMLIAISWAADWYHNSFLSLIEKHFPKNFPVNDNNLEEEAKAVFYIAKRFKFNLDLIKHFKIGYAPQGYDNLYKAAKKAAFKPDVLIKAGLVKIRKNQNKEYFGDFFVHRPMIIPIHNTKGYIVAFTARQMPWQKAVNESGKPYPKYINTAETPLYKKQNILFGFDNATQSEIRKADKCYIVEGNLDKTSLYHIGIKNVIAKSGTALTDKQIESIKRLTKNICLIDDGDNAGQLAMLKAGEKLTLQGCNVTVITLPEKQDPDSFFKSNEQFKEFEKENERDYIIDVRGEELNESSNIQIKKSVKKAIAELLLKKTKEDREEYITAIVKNTETTKTEWLKAVKQAALEQRDKGLNIAEDEEEATIKPDNSADNLRKHSFYFIKKNKNGEPEGIQVDERRFLLLLKSTRTYEFERNGKQHTITFGFFTYTLTSDESDLIFIQLKNGKMKKVSVNFIKKTFFQFVRQLKPVEYTGFTNDGREWTKIISSKEIETYFLKKITTLFEEKRLILFPDKEIKLLKDSIDKHYTFFRNCYVISDKNGYKIHNYEDLKEGYVWDDAVLDRDFYPPKDKTPGVFEKFLHDISGNEWKLSENQAIMKEELRYKSLLIAGGYMLHNYTEMQRKAVILTQGRISEDDTSEGREGKTLFVESLGRYMLNKHPEESKTYVYVPGKDLKNDDKHKWQDLELNTTAVLYDDPPAWINFEDLYNLAERAFKVEKKRQNNIYVKARIFITTNRPLDRDSGSSKARSCVIELDSIFHADYTPVDKYKHYFFRDWTGSKAEEWHKFSHFILGTMLPAYFKNEAKLLEPPSKNLYRNELLQKARRLTGNMEIVFWLDFLVKGDHEHEPFFKTGESYTTKELFEKLANDRDVKDNKKLKRNFTKIVKSYFEKEGIKVEQRRVSSGTEFKIIAGLPEKIKIHKEYILSFFKNGHNKDEIYFEEQLADATEDFNTKYNMNIKPEQLKEATEEIFGEIL